MVSNCVKGSNFTFSPCGCCGCGWWQAEKTMQAPTWHQSESNKCRARRAHRRARRTKHQFWCKKRLQALYSLEKGLVASNDSDQCSSRSKVSFAARQKHSMHSPKRWVPVRLAQEQYEFWRICMTICTSCATFQQFQPLLHRTLPRVPLVSVNSIATHLHSLAGR